MAAAADAAVDRSSSARAKTLAMAEGAAVAVKPPVAMPAVEEHVAVDAAPEPKVLSTVLNGILNGVSGSGHLLGVMPALAMPSWVCAGAYLGCFGLGTLVAMACFTALVGELSSQMGERLDDPATPARLSMASSIFALLMGSIWTTRALSMLSLPVWLTLGTVRDTVGRIGLLRAVAR